MYKNKLRKLGSGHGNKEAIVQGLVRILTIQHADKGARFRYCFEVVELNPLSNKLPLSLYNGRDDRLADIVKRTDHYFA